MSEKFKYTDQYFSYHRNMIIYFILCIAVSLFGVKIKDDGFGPLEGLPSTLVILIPAALFISALYNWMLFHAEWKDCAEPHRSQTEDASNRLNVEMQNLLKKHSEIQAELNGGISMLQEHSESYVIAGLRYQFQKERSQEIQGWLATIAELRSAMTGHLNGARDQISHLEHRPLEDLKQQLILVFKDQNISETAIGEIAFFGSIYFDKIYSIFEEMTDSFEQSARQSSEEMTRSARSYRDTLDRQNHYIKQVDDYSRRILDSLENFSSRSDEFKNLVEKMRRFSLSKRDFVWAKTQLAGLDLPIVLFVIALGSTLSHYIGLYTDWVLSQP